MSSGRRAAIIAGVALLAVLGAFLLLQQLRPTLSEEELREHVIATIQREAKASFLVTGTLDIVATTSVQNTRRILPELLDLRLGTSSATIQVPGRAYYGFDVRTLRPQHITLIEDSIVEIQVPRAEVLSVEPNLREMRVWTSKGWARTSGSTRRAERQALALINGALMRQAKTHLASSVQPHMNTADALKVMLTPTLKSLGIEDPSFRFRLGEQMVIEPPGVR